MSRALGHARSESCGFRVDPSRCEGARAVGLCVSGAGEGGLNHPRAPIRVMPILSPCWSGWQAGPTAYGQGMERGQPTLLRMEGSRREGSSTSAVGMGDGRSLVLSVQDG